MTISELDLSRRDQPARSHARLAPIPVFRSFDSDLAVRLVERAGLNRAVVAGEIDLATAPVVEEVLTDLLIRNPSGLELDLGDVTFLDCSGLNALLRLRERAAEKGVALTVSALSPTVGRVLDITSTRALFTVKTPLAPAPRTVRAARTGRTGSHVARG
jgi:anti-anti-sigma factor